MKKDYELVNEHSITLCIDLLRFSNVKFKFVITASLHCMKGTVLFGLLSACVSCRPFTSARRRTLALLLLDHQPNVWAAVIVKRDLNGVEGESDHEWQILCGAKVPNLLVKLCHLLLLPEGTIQYWCGAKLQC